MTMITSSNNAPQISNQKTATANDQSVDNRTVGTCVTTNDLNNDDNERRVTSSSLSPSHVQDVPLPGQDIFLSPSQKIFDKIFETTNNNNKSCIKLLPRRSKSNHKRSGILFPNGKSTVGSFVAASDSLSFSNESMSDSTTSSSKKRKSSGKMASHHNNKYCINLLPKISRYSEFAHGRRTAAIGNFNPLFSRDTATLSRSDEKLSENDTMDSYISSTPCVGRDNDIFLPRSPVVSRSDESLQLPEDLLIPMLV